MITFLNEFGYTIWTTLGLLTLHAIIYKCHEGPPTAEENKVIMDSLSGRESFLSNRTESKWVQD